MSEISKFKIGFALALLGVLFAFNPLIIQSEISLIFYSVSIKLKTFYWVFVSLLGISVYCYGLALIGEQKVFKIIKKFGNIIYSVTLIYPLLILSLFGISQLLKIISNSEIAELTVKILTSFFLAFVGGFVGYFVQKLLNFLFNGDQLETIKTMGRKSDEAIIRVKLLVDNGFFELATIELCKAIELNLDKAFVIKKIDNSSKTFYNKLLVAKRNELISDLEFKFVNSIRKDKDKAINDSREFELTKEAIEDMIKKTDSVLYNLDNHIQAR